MKNVLASPLTVSLPTTALLLAAAVSFSTFSFAVNAFATPQQLSSATSSAGGGDISEHHHHWGGEQREKLSERLGLTPDQREKIKSLRSDHDEQEKSELKIKLARIELKELLEKDAAGEDEILKHAEEISKMMVDQNMQHVRHVLAIRKILTPEQRKKFRDFMAEHKTDEHHDENMRGDKAGFGEKRGFGGRFGERREEFHKRFGNGDRENDNGGQ